MMPAVGVAAGPVARLGPGWRAAISALPRAAVAIALAGLLTLPAFADDTEIYVNPNAVTNIRPNILLIVDTSGSMDSAVTGARAPYDPNQTYSGECPSGQLYWRTGAGDPPDCGSQNNVTASANACAAAAAAITSGGLWAGTAAQWNTSELEWAGLDHNNGAAPLECADDAGKDGPSAGSPLLWARDGDDQNRWTSDPTQQIDWTSRGSYTLYSANWLNWYYSAPSDQSLSRLDVVKSVASTLVNSVSNVNIGLMRFSDNGGHNVELSAEGGMVLHAATDVSTSRSSLLDQINALSAGGRTPLSETLYEAGQYLAGRAVDYGINSQIDPETPFPSVPESRNPTNPAQYASPIQYQCQRNYVVLLTDGEPTADNSADGKIAALPGFGSLGLQCDASGPGRCLTAMAGYLHQGDLSSLAGRQSATTYTIGFGPDVQGSDLLTRVAQAGGGQTFAANDVNGLTNAFQQILSDIQRDGSTFTSPAVSINAFNRAQSQNDLYISVFQPGSHLHWPGNLKKYGFQNGQIVDSVGRSAIDPTTGFFAQGTQSFWSPSPDDNRVTAGGAVSRQPDPSQRKIYTQLTGTTNVDLTTADNVFDVSNAGLTDALLGTSATGPTRTQVIQWARGVDVKDENGNGSTTDAHPLMGDPLHAKPALVVYGGQPTSPDNTDAVVFVTTNDGFLHAVNAVTGVELWAFIPPELLSRLSSLFTDPVVANRTYGLDGDVTVLRFDANRDGVIDASAGDKVWIYFGMRRGGRYYYALDVTDRAHPQLLWKLGPNELPGVGETWSAPVVTRVNINGASQNGEHLVLIMGGGYDPAQENVGYTTDASGNRLFMVDARSGALLWYAGGSGGPGTPDRVLPQMSNSIPARVTVIDTDGDQYADRIYAADMGGQIWRFDINNGSTRSELVSGGVLASLGAAGEKPPQLQDARRFYYAPDVALIQRRGADPYFNLAIGSGYRGHPLNTAIHDRFYSIRDKSPFSKLAQSTYDSLAPITESDLVDVSASLLNTPVPTTARGWMLQLDLNGGWVGEKVLAEALTVNGVVLFPTYQPVAAANLDPCTPANGLNRAYALQVDTGRPAVDFNHDGQITADDAWTRLSQTGIAGEVNFLFDATASASTTAPGGQPATGSGNTSAAITRDALGRRALCMVGVEVLQQCVAPGSVVRTFWQRTAPN
jgi:type IV pilus assembly protein PilY1